MGDWWWVWAVLLLVVGMAVAVLELFIPSGGLLGFLAFCSIIAAIVVAFLQGPSEGVAFLAAAVFALPAVIVLALKWWPKTRIGQRFLLGVPESDDVLPNGNRRRYRELIGRTGRAKSPMLPGGMIVIDGQTLSAISDGVPIEAGQPVRVVNVQATTLVVRPIEEAALEERKADDPLSRPIDAVGPDPFEQPGA